MSMASGKERPKDYEIECELLPAATFNVAATFDPKDIEGIPVGGFSLDETVLLETTVFDASESAARPSGKVEKLTKTGLYQELANATKLSKKQVAEVFDALAAVIRKELSKKGPGEFVLPGLLKLKLVRKPATKAGKRPNPFKPGEMMEVKARSARNVVKPRLLKALQEMVE